MLEVFKFLVLCLVSICATCLTASWFYTCVFFFLLALVFHDYNFAIGLERHAVTKLKQCILKVRNIHPLLFKPDKPYNKRHYTPTMNSVNKQTNFELSRFNKSANPVSPIVPNNASNVCVTSRRLIQSRQTSTPLTKTSPWQKNSLNSPSSARYQSSASGTPRYSLSSVNSTPKLTSHETPTRPTIQTITGPLLASTRFNINLGTYSETKSPGLASRVAQYHNELSGSQSSTHQSKYGGPGQFPIVHLYKKDLPILARTPRRCTVRIAPPDPVSYNSEQANTILRESFVQNLDSAAADSEISTRSVLEALKEISRKRIHANDDASDMSKRQRKSSLSSSSNSSEQLNKDGKRAREDSPPKPKESSAVVNGTPKRICVVNEIESSLSSSRLLRLQQGQKRKAPLNSAEKINKQRRMSNGNLVSRETQTVPAVAKPAQNATPETVAKTSTAAQTEEEPEEVEDVLLILQNARRKPSPGAVKSIQDVDAENSTLPFRPKTSTPVKPIFSEAPLEIMKKNKLAVMLSALGGHEPDIIPVPDVTLSGLKHADKVDGEAGNKEIVSILSPRNKAKHDRHVTFDIPVPPTVAPNEKPPENLPRSENSGPDLSQPHKTKENVIGGVELADSGVAPPPGGFSASGVVSSSATAPVFSFGDPKPPSQEKIEAVVTSPGFGASFTVQLGQKGAPEAQKSPVVDRMKTPGQASPARVEQQPAEAPKSFGSGINAPSVNFGLSALFGTKNPAANGALGAKPIVGLISATATTSTNSGSVPAPLFPTTGSFSPSTTVGMSAVTSVVTSGSSLAISGISPSLGASLTTPVVSAVPAANIGILFGVPASSAAAVKSVMSIGAPVTSANFAPTLGASVGASGAPVAVSFGQVSSLAPSSAGPIFGFGPKPEAKPTAPPKPATTVSSFTFGSSTTQKPAAGFKFEFSKSPAPAPTSLAPSVNSSTPLGPSAPAAVPSAPVETSSTPGKNPGEKVSVFGFGAQAPASSTASGVFGARTPFGGPQATAPAFGAGTTNPFGNNTTTGTTFGTAVTVNNNSAPFGVSSTTVGTSAPFGGSSTTSNAFGAPSTTSTGGNATFGVANAAGGFGASQTNPGSFPGAFGAPSSTSAPTMFGGAPTGATGPAGPTGFGTKPADPPSGFGGFGQPGAAPTSQPAVFGVGGASTAAPGAFGTFNQFGGAPATTAAFGGAKPFGFGAQPPATATTTSGSMFGSATATSAPVFGGATGGTFGPSGGFSSVFSGSNTNSPPAAASANNPPGGFGTQPFGFGASSGVFAFGGAGTQPAAFQFSPQKPAGFNFSASQNAAPNINFNASAPANSFPAAPAFGAPGGSMFNIGSGSTAPKQRPVIKARRRNN